MTVAALLFSRGGKKVYRFNQPQEKTMNHREKDELTGELCPAGLLFGFIILFSSVFCRK